MTELITLAFRERPKSELPDYFLVFIDVGVNIFFFFSPYVCLLVLKSSEGLEFDLPALFPEQELLGHLRLLNFLWSMCLNRSIVETELGRLNAIFSSSKELILL
jgi:hypothetical protein